MIHRQKPIARYRSQATEVERLQHRIALVDLNLEDYQGRRADYLPKRRLLDRRQQLVMELARCQ